MLSSKPRPFATREELAIAVNFLALQAARVPLSKGKYESLIIENGHRFLHKVAHHPEFRQELVDMGALEESDIETLEEGPSLVELVKRGEIRPVAEKSILSVSILHLAAAIFEEIASMKATLWYSGEPDWFVCSDNPVWLPCSMAGNVSDDRTVLENPQVQLLTDSIYMPCKERCFGNTSALRRSTTATSTPTNGRVS
jgi:hypothetical protein